MLGVEHVAIVGRLFGGGEAVPRLFYLSACSR
jgi:hypothetical protein